ncbi:MAG: nucleotide exchange factor GrpE [Thermoplasmata archaeon]
MPGVSYYRSLKQSLSDCSHRLKEMQQKIEEKDREIGELKEQTLRFAADLDNFQKKLRAEQEALASYAAERIIRELLPVLDSMESSEDDGIKAIRKQMEGILQKEGVTVIEDREQFDPTKHEVVGVEEGGQANTIKKVIRKGYLLGGRVIRPELVIINKGD